MTQSFSKLELLLTDNGFIPKNIFTIDGYCVYIEVLCISNAETFLLYIPSNFNIKANKDFTYKLKYIDIENSTDVISKYAKEPDNIDIKNTYDEIDINNAHENDEDLEKSLNENYNREIFLRDLNREDKESLKDIFRQLNRFKFCVQNIKYKLIILYKNFISAIKRDDTVECYYINNFNSNSERKLYITIDLKSFYEKVSSVRTDIKIVKDSIFKILNQNHIKHSKLLNNMLDNKVKLIYCSELVYKKKEYYEQYISELETLLGKLEENETKLLKEKNASDVNTEYGIKGMHEDIQRSHMSFQLTSKIQKNNELKEELIQDLIKTRKEQENITLLIDKILFDNSIMLNEIIKNFNSITKILE
jgi:hypothetical protein